MPMNAGDFGVTTGLAKRVYDRWTGASPASGQADHEGTRNGFVAPLPAAAQAMLKSQIYSFAKELVAELAANFRASMVLAQVPGPLPVTSVALTTGGGTLLVVFGGSAISAAVGKQQLDLKIDAVLKGSTSLYFGQAATRLAFPTRALVVTGVAAGSHTLSLESAATTDVNDAFGATVVELPV
jgi:hypothetical protein